MINRVFLSLGSNINPRDNLVRAVRKISEYGTVRSASSVWETAPVGYTNQDNFLNAVVLLETKLPLDELSQQVIPGIERDLGRKRGKNKFGPRSIDIDILLFNDRVGEFGRLKLPNREILERSFVSIPLAEIAPEDIHPELGIRMKAIAARFAISPDEMKRIQDLDLMQDSIEDAESGQI